MRVRGYIDRSELRSLCRGLFTPLLASSGGVLVLLPFLVLYCLLRIPLKVRSSSRIELHFLVGLI